MSYGTQWMLAIWLTLLTFLVSVLVHDFIDNHNQRVVIGIGTILAIEAFIVLVVKVKSSDSPADMKFLASTIRNALET